MIKHGNKIEMYDGSQLPPMKFIFTKMEMEQSYLVKLFIREEEEIIVHISVGEFVRCSTGSKCN